MSIIKRKITVVKFTTFFSEENVESIKRYLEFEMEDIKPDDHYSQGTSPVETT